MIETVLSYDKIQRKSISFYAYSDKKEMEYVMDRVKENIHYWCEDIKARNVDGKGVCTAILDTGLADHPDLRGRVLAFQDLVNGRTGMYDDSGHGTHVAGILAGDGRLSRGKYAGIAPGSELVVVKVLNRYGEGCMEHIERGIQWIYQERKRWHIQIVNISVGAKENLEKQQTEHLIGAVEMLWDLGMMVVVSAGNYGPGAGTVTVPGTSRKVITVGAVNDRNSQKNCSGEGPTEQCVVKPDIVAPGYGIVSLNQRWRQYGIPYVEKSGSSMATPIVAGAMALLWSKYPDMSNVEGKLRLRERSDREKGKELVQGWGMLNVEKLLR